MFNVLRNAILALSYPDLWHESAVIDQENVVRTAQLIVDSGVNERDIVLFLEISSHIEQLISQNRLRVV